MKHGHKKGKAKATPSGKKSKTAAKDKSSVKAAGAKAAPARAGKNDGTFSFNNPAVAAAFKRAVKKYSSAFRRLTD